MVLDGAKASGIFKYNPANGKTDFHDHLAFPIRFQVYKKQFKFF